MRTIAQRVIKTIADQIGIDEGQVSAAANLRADLGLDSLDDIEIVMAIEDEFEIDVADEDAQTWKSAADIVGYVERGTKA